RRQPDRRALVARRVGHRHFLKEGNTVETWVTLGTAAVLGFLHALEVDHMLAVTAFVSRRPALTTAAGFGARWGVGHSISVCLAGGILLATGVRWPERYDSVGEIVVGVLLIGLGAWALRSASKLHLHPAGEHGDHAHVHHHGAGEAAHEHHHHHANGHGITWVGMLHGLAGTTGVVALVPVTLIASRLVGFGYLVAFGVGVTAGMTVFAFIAAAAMRTAAERSLLWGRRLAGVVGVAGIAVGVWWVVRAAGVLSR
ncbi:MAG TPA: hypothetical protein VFS28_02590, partial [Gemmatimonadales bacterium]|nr:hypothetical protein [Gemmatimonadales bacterium]